MTRRAFRRFRFAIFALLWLGAAALQVYVSDVGTHGVMLGAYLPAWLLSVASIPPWTLLAIAVFDLLIALVALRVSVILLRVLAFLNGILLVVYAFISVAILFYVAFANSGIS